MNYQFKTGVATAEIAEGVFTFAQAGIQDLTDLQKLAESISKIPLAATFGTIDQAVEGVLAITGQFNLEISETARILDLVNQFAAADFATESQDIFDAVKRGGASFASAGGTFEEFIQLFSILREGTRESAETLGTFFKSGFAQLLQDSSQAQMRKLGVTTSDLVGQLTQLAEILGPDSGFSTLETVNIARELTGVRQFSRLLALLRELRDEDVTGRRKEALENATGSLDRDVVVRLDDISVSIDRVTKAFTDFVISLADNEPLKRFLETIGNVATEISSLATTLFKFEATLPILAAIAGFTLVRPAVGKFAAGASSLFGQGRGRWCNWFTSKFRVIDARWVKSSIIDG